MQRYQDEPLEIGVRIKPQTREQRRILSDRDYLEKQRVMGRKENFERHQEAQFRDDGFNEHHRFGDDFEAENRRQAELKKQQKLEYLRQMGEEAKQRDQYYVSKDEEERKRYDEGLAARGTKKNVSGEKFDIITREYRNEQDRMAVEQQHQKQVAAADARKQNLLKQQGGGMNLLTGEPFPWAAK